MHVCVRSLEVPPGLARDVIELLVADARGARAAAAIGCGAGRCLPSQQWILLANRLASLLPYFAVPEYC